MQLEQSKRKERALKKEKRSAAKIGDSSRQCQREMRDEASTQKPEIGRTKAKRERREGKREKKRKREKEKERETVENKGMKRTSEKGKMKDGSLLGSSSAGENEMGARAAVSRKKIQGVLIKSGTVLADTKRVVM